MPPVVYIILAIAVVIVLAIIVTAARPRPKEDVHRIYTQGLDYLLRGDLGPAYQSFRKVIDRDTDHVSAYLKLGEVMRRSGAPDRRRVVHPGRTGSERGRSVVRRSVRLQSARVGLPLCDPARRHFATVPDRAGSPPFDAIRPLGH